MVPIRGRYPGHLDRRYIADRRQWKRNMQIARRGKFIPQVPRRMSSDMRRRQFALRRMANSKNVMAKKTLAEIRSKAKYNLYKLVKALQARAVVRRAVARYRYKKDMKGVPERVYKEFFP